MTELPATFGKYYLTEKLATGGMAEIYLGKILGPAGFEKQLVLKLIHPSLSGQRQFVDLFVAEAKTLVGLTHGNIVPVYELGVVDGIYFIAMEYIDGPTLQRFTDAVTARGERLAPPVAAWIAAEIVDGLDYAHRKGEGIIHRDLSPRNVMLSRDGEVKLVDFGIAVTVDNRGDAGAGAPTGSFPYMSPEQVRRQRLTGASDVFSAGVLLWEMLTGKRLFARATPDDTLRAVLEDDIPPPSAVRDGVPTRLDEVVARALARDADGRAGAAELLAALNRYLYSLDDAPGARDVAALVARHCPPVVRRAGSDGAGEATERRAADTELDAGPRTVPVARDGTGPRGKGRPPTAREEIFATHVELEKVLARATPLFPIAAIREEAKAAEAAPPPAAAAPTPAPAPPPPAPRPPRRATWAGALIVAVALGAVAVAWQVRGDAPAAAPPVLDARGTDPVRDAGSAADARPADAAPADAPRPIDAGGPPVDARPVLPSPVRDAGLVLDARRAEPDAGSSPLLGRVKVGASPWGEVRIDGRPLGRTPGTWPVPAGAHEIEVIFPGADPPQRKLFPVRVAPGEELTVFAEFSP